MMEEAMDFYKTKKKKKGERKSEETDDLVRLKTALKERTATVAWLLFSSVRVRAIRGGTMTFS